MTKNKKMFSLIFVVIILLVIITIGLVVYSLDNNRITPYPAGTEVGYVYIGGKNTWQAENALKDEVNKWKTAKNLTIDLSYQDNAYSISVDPSIFKFDVASSIQNVVSDKKMNYDKGVNVIKVDFVDGKENYIDQLLQAHYSDLKFSKFDITAIKKDILRYVSYLYKEIYIDLGDYVDKDTAETTPVGKPITINYTESDFLKYRYDNIINAPIEIKPREQFSLNDYIISLYQNIDVPETKINDVNKLDSKYFTQEELNVLATGIYQTILDTNFVNIKKNISDQLPAFVTQAGLEATSVIDYKYTTEQKIDDENIPYTAITGVEFNSVKDLSFYNPNNNSYYIKVTTTTNESNQTVLVFQLYGTPFINSYSHVFYLNQEITQGETLWPESTWNNQPVQKDDKILVDPGYLGYHSILQRITNIAHPRDNQDKKVYTLLSEDIYMPKNAVFVVSNDTSNE